MPPPPRCHCHCGDNKNGSAINCFARLPLSVWVCVRLRCAHVDAASGASANGIDNASAEWELGLALRLFRRVLNGEGWRCFLSSFFIVFVLHSSRMHFIGQGTGPKQWHSNWWHLAEHASALSPLALHPLTICPLLSPPRWVLSCPGTLCQLPFVLA